MGTAENQQGLEVISDGNVSYNIKEVEELLYFTARIVKNVDEGNWCKVMGWQKNDRKAEPHSNLEKYTIWN